MKYAAIADWVTSKEHTVEFMCRELGVSRSGYYEWSRRPASDRFRQDRVLTRLIQGIHARLRGNPGVRRVHAELAVLGHRVSPKRVWRLMREADLRGRYPRAWRRTTVPGLGAVQEPDLIGQDFTAGEPNQKWCGDITFIRTWQGWAYLATVIDLHSRTIVGWAVSDHMRTSLVIDALTMAIRHRKPIGVIFHSDRGCQYTSAEFAAFCSANNIRRSLGRTGICFDNSVAESFFATYKKELIHSRPWPGIAALKNATFDWIETYYNTQRRHSTLGYLTPREYELGYRNLNEIAA